MRAVLKSEILIPKSQMFLNPSREGFLIPLRAGLLTLASSNWPPSHSRRAGAVALWAVLHDYSGGAVPDFHRTSLSSSKSTRSNVLILLTLNCRVLSNASG